MAGFVHKKSYLPDFHDVDDVLIINNSVTVTLGDMLKAVVSSTQGADLAAAGNRIFGVAKGFVCKDGVLNLENATSGVDYDGTFTSGGVDVGAYAAASDNVTDKNVKVRINVNPYAIFSNTPDAAIGTTSGQNLKGAYTDIADEDQIDENNASAAATTVAQCIVMGIDPDNSSNGLYMIVEWQQYAK